MANTAELNKKLDDAVLAGKALEAFDVVRRQDLQQLRAYPFPPHQRMLPNWLRIGEAP